jgi:hypothetical protein
LAKISENAYKSSKESAPPGGNTLEDTGGKTIGDRRRDLRKKAFEKQRDASKNQVELQVRFTDTFRLPGMMKQSYFQALATGGSGESTSSSLAGSSSGPTESGKMSSRMGGGKKKKPRKKAASADKLEVLLQKPHETEFDLSVVERALFAAKK